MAVSRIWDWASSKGSLGGIGCKPKGSWWGLDDSRRRQDGQAVAELGKYSQSLFPELRCQLDNGDQRVPQITHVARSTCRKWVTLSVVSV